MATAEQKQSATWLTEIIQLYYKDMKDPFRKRVEPKIGNLYLYMYDAKYKAVLPIWDVFPLVIPLEPEYRGGFLGLNLHYLPPAGRANLFKTLKSITLNNDKYNTTTKLESVSYMVLQEYARHELFKNCVKRYLFDRVVGKSFYYVHPEQWNYTISLPLQKWVINTKYGGSAPY